jgi:hypothetical protein
MGASTPNYGSGAGAVASVFGRTGTVTAQSGDYTTAKVTESGNLYFTTARVLAVVGGWVSTAWSSIDATTTIQAFINRAGTALNTLMGGGSAGQVWTNVAGTPAWANPGASFVVNAQTGTTYTLQSSDAGGVVTMNNASAITLTCSGLADGNYVIIEQLGAGQVTFSTGTLTVRHVASLTKIAGQYGRVYARVSGSNIILSGDMS